MKRELLSLAIAPKMLAWLSYRGFEAYTVVSGLAATDIMSKVVKSGGEWISSIDMEKHEP